MPKVTKETPRRGGDKSSMRPIDALRAKVFIRPRCERFRRGKVKPRGIYHYFSSKDEIIQASFDFDYQRSIELFKAAKESENPLAALNQVLAFLFNGLNQAAELGAGRVNVQGWGEALVNPKLARGIRRVLDNYLDEVSHIIRRAQELDS